MSDQFKTGEVSFDDIPSDTGGNRRGGLYLNMKEQGQYKLRVASKPFQYYCHWVETTDGRRRKVNATCDATDPIVADQGKGPQMKWLFKVLHLNTESGNPEMKILDAGRQIVSQIKQLHDDADNFGNVSKYDILVTKGPKGANPLYTVQAIGSEAAPRELNAVEKQLIVESRDENSDNFINLERLATPWSAERILEVINGTEGSTAKPASTESSAFTEHEFSSDDDFMDL